MSVTGNDAGLTADKQHILALDGLRGLAIALVLVCHEYNPIFHEHGSLPDRLMWRYTVAGWVGVDLFFCLSGFLLTGVLYETQRRRHALRNFYARRILRTFPLYYGVLLALIGTTLLLGYHWFRPVFLWLTYTDNFAIHSRVTDAPGVYVAHFWSLAVEEQFYLFWPLLVIALKTRRRIFMAAVGLALGCLAFRYGIGHTHLIVRDDTVLYYWTPARLDGMLMGAAVAMLVRSSWRQRMFTWSRWVVAAGVVGGLAFISWHGLYMFWDPVISTVGYSAVAVVFAALIARVMVPGRLQRVFQSPVLRFLGRYSYGIYVFEPFVDLFVRRVVLPRLSRTVHSNSLVFDLRGTIVTVLLVGLAYLSYEWYERRFLRLKRYFQ